MWNLAGFELKYKTFELDSTKVLRQDSADSESEVLVISDYTQWHDRFIEWHASTTRLK